ncbi:MAG TPA: sugar kinase [bacterium]|nr:sugar kinase [bacterium]
MAATVLGVGETMVRLMPGQGETLESAPAYAVSVGGAESNVCMDLAALGVKTAWVSRLPRNPLGRRIAAVIRSTGVDIDGVVWAAEGRAGVYLVQPAVSPRSGEVHYYRHDSAFTKIDPDSVNWDVLNGVRVIHLTGITPALSPEAHRLVKRVILEGSQRHNMMSFDVNYRAQLWSPTAAREVLEPLVQGLDVVIVSNRDAATVFGERGEPAAVAQALRLRFRCRTLVLTLGAAGAFALDESGAAQQPAYSAEIVDRIGRGDAFTAGFLYGYLQHGTGEGLRYGTALAALKQTYMGDVFYGTLADVEAILHGDAGGLRR